MLLGAPGLAAAGDAAPVDFRIPAQTVPAALSDFARQARVQLFFISDGFEEVRANAVFGTYTPQAALDLLLEGTGLRANLSDDSGIEVKPVSGAMSGVGEGSQLVAAAEVPGRAAGSTEIGEERGSPNQDAPASGSTGRKASEAIEEVVVTGTHIRGVENVGALSMTFDRQDIDNTGYSSVEEIFRTLPQNLHEITADGAFAQGASAIASANRGVGASSISLRGLGPGSTLVLLNGKRRPGNLRGRAVDVSAIPLSMIDRIEIVTGGHSAVYGSEAVAGVVNIMTTRTYNGADSQVYYGESPAGGQSFEFSQTFGRNFDRGSFILGYTYRKEHALEASKAGVAGGPSSSGRSPVPGLFDLHFPSEQHVGMFTGSLELSEHVELYADAHFSADENEAALATEIAFGLAQQGGLSVTKSDQYSASAGVRFDVGRQWQIDISTLYGVVNNTNPFASVVAIAPDTITSLDIPPTTEDDDQARLKSFSAVADGPLGSLGKHGIYAALGLELRTESYTRARRALPAGVRVPQENGDRDIWSVFGEIRLPLSIGGGNDLNVSVAGRYDNYSDFGDTFNPQFGIDWEPVDGVVFRGSYSTAFRAPDLYTLALDNQILISPVPDPLAPSGTTIAMGEFGGNPDLQPEEADTWTVGLDWEIWDRGRVSLSYFNIDYSNRIDEPEPALAAVLQNEVYFPGLVDRMPTSEKLAEIFARTDLASFLNFTGVPFDPTSDDPLATFPGLVEFDGRRNNIAIEEVDGIDLQASTHLSAGRGRWNFDLNGTYYLNFRRRITPTAPAIEQLNKPGKLVDLKLRAHVGWSTSAWSINSYVNYVDDYVDTFSQVPTKIDSWTTLDLNVAFDASSVGHSRFSQGLKATLGVSNLLDRDPPEFLSNTFGLTYDGANSDPIGRFVSLRLSKRW